MINKSSILSDGESDGVSCIRRAPVLVSIPISRFWCESQTPQVKTSNGPLEPNPIKVQKMQCIARVLIRTLRATSCVFNLKIGVPTSE